GKIRARGIRIRRKLLQAAETSATHPPTSPLTTYRRDVRFAACPPMICPPGLNCTTAMASSISVIADAGTKRTACGSGAGWGRYRSANAQLVDGTLRATRGSQG